MAATNQLALVADVGGTNARFALADLRSRKLYEIKKLKVSDFGSLEAVSAAYLSAISSTPEFACFAIAGPVGGERCKLTNANWSFTPSSIRQATGVRKIAFVNDYDAQAQALPDLTASDLRQIGGGTAAEGSAKAVVGPGTGLGVAGLVRLQGDWTTIVGEGGHVTFAAETDEDFEIFRRLQGNFLRVSAERVISGPGLSLVFDTVCEINGLSTPRLAAEGVVERARSGTDPIAQKVTELFAKWLGRFAGDVALTLGASGGVYIAGGIPPRMLDILTAGGFRAGFEAKGRMTELMKHTPTYVVLNDEAGLRGAAAIASNVQIPTASSCHSREASEHDGTCE